MVPFSFAGQEFALIQGRALYWPRENALLVADLHLEKASFFARHGQMLPPYDSRETLERLALAIRETGARRVYTLGDNFHDSAGPSRLEPHAAGMLAALTRATDWVWITGNHDSAMEATAGGTLAEELEIAGLVLRHRATRGETRPELSGHYHPRLHITVRQRRIRRPCAVISTDADGAGQRLVAQLGEADQVVVQLVFEEAQLAVHGALEGVGADGALAQQHVQQLVVGAHLFHEGLDRAAHHAVLGLGAVAGGADDLAQRLAGDVDQGHDQFVHVAELAVEAVGGDAGLAGDFAQAQAGHAAMWADQAERRFQQVGLGDRRAAARVQVVGGGVRGGGRHGRAGSG